MRNANPKAEQPGRVIPLDHLDDLSAFDRLKGLPAAESEVAKDVVQDGVQLCLADFERTKLGAFLWRAYVTARAGHVAVPDRVLEYFDWIAAVVQGGATPEELAEAMHLCSRRGGASLSTRLKRAEKTMRIVVDTRALYTGIGMEPSAPRSKAEARRLVAKKYGCSPDHVKKIVGAFK